MTFQIHLIVDYIKYKQPSNIYLGDNRVIKAYGEGTVKLQCYDGADGITLALNNYHLLTETEGNSVFCGPETVDISIVKETTN